MAFQLHPQLANDSCVIGDFALSRVLLMNDCQYPWLILVPRRHDIREIYQLDEADRLQLLAESCWLAQVMETLYTPDKLNIAAIGNLVPQLHLHHVARYQADAAWPAPVWGKLPRKPYAAQALDHECQRLRDALAAYFISS